jgi:uncharacterized protein (UPF0264 family)
MALLVRRHIGWPAGQKIGQTLWRATLAAAVMATAARASVQVLTSALGPTGSTARLAVVGAAVVGAGLIYLGLASLLRLEEVTILWRSLSRRFRHTR